ncbi:hypothetical protein [Geitlerinema sp. PCC 9228]|jgi:hypothetical protein|uniref:photosystem II assembly protein Psb35 n=1 Tax=Geitlerinema sp. PCC 9228 TaxID=111611 RepID=UPI0008F9917D|nr:hypothetical protein [Geitlerinema sp. PCC 9228]
MHLFMEASSGIAGLPLSFTLVYAIGFIAAVTIGSIAWYNSKRPAGWENQKRPDFIPKVQNPDEQQEDNQDAQQ